MELHWQGQLTERDLRRAFRLAYSAVPIPWTFAVLLLALPVVILIMVLCTGPLQPAAIVHAIGEWWPGLLVFTLLAAIATLRLWLPPLSAARAYRSNPEKHSLLSGTVTPAGVTISTAHTQADLAWPSFTQYRRSRDLVVLYVSPRLCHLFPRRFFLSDGDWQTFNEWVAQHVSAARAQQATAGQWTHWLRRAFVLLLVAIAIFSLFLNLSQGS